jgi:hypothetical protein
VIARLEASGHQVTIAAGQDALPVLSEGRDGEVEEARSLLPGIGMVATVQGVVGRVSGERLALVRDDIEVLISDGDMPAILAAKLMGCPSIAIGHGLVFSHGEPPKTASSKRWRREARKARAASWTSTRQVAVNFVPVAPGVDTVTMARPEIRPELVRAADVDRVVTYFRDDNGARALSALVEAGHTPLLFTDAPCSIEGVEVHPRDPAAFTRALCRARAVVSSAGSQLISECVHLGVPQFALFEDSDDEQALNVEMLAAAGLGGGSSFQTLEATDLETFLESCDTRRQEATSWEAPRAGEAVTRLVEELLA